MIYSANTGASNENQHQNRIRVHCLFSNVSREGGEIQLRHSGGWGEISLSSGFLFAVVIHSDFSMPLNILYTSKMQGKLMSLYLPSYQHKPNFNITLSSFLHKVYKTYYEKYHTLEGDLILAKNYLLTLDHISHFCF